MARNATNITATENSENTAPETTVKKPKKKEISLTDRVPITNLNDWELHFVSTETDKDIVIPARANKIRKLTVAEIDGQVQSGNAQDAGRVCERAQDLP